MLELKRIDTVFLPVADLERSIAWYTEKLGLKLRWKYQDYACLNVGETPLTLVRVATVPKVSHMLFNFYAPDIQAAHRHLAEAGVEVTDVVDHGDVVEFQFPDPDGNPLGFCWYETK